MPGTLLRNRTGSLRIPVVIIGSFIVTFLGVIPGLGLPGVIMMLVGESLLHWPAKLLGFPSIFSIGGDTPWAAAIMLTWTLAPLLVLAYLLAFRAFGHLPTYQQWLVWGACFVVWSVVGTAIVTWMAFRTPVS